MGSITQLNDKLRTVPQQLVSDDQARAAIQELSAFKRDAELLEGAVRKGLLAISVPSDFGGADLPNELIADLVSTLARQSESAAHRALSHFVALELIRSAGTTEQRRGIYNRVLIGEWFAHAGFDCPATASAARGIGLRLDLAANILPDLQQNWTVLPVVDEHAKGGVAVVPAGSADEGRSDTGLHLPGDHVLALRQDAEQIARALEVLLEAAIHLGVLTSAFGQRPAQEAAADHGVLAELISAMITRVSGMIDGLQVGSVIVDVSSLERSVFALRDLNRKAGASQSFT